jgi:hypothetical protein
LKNTLSSQLQSPLEDFDETHSSWKPTGPKTEASEFEVGPVKIENQEVRLAFGFYTPVFRRDVLWYSVVRLSVCLSGPCRQDRDRTVSSRIIQLGILDHHHERKNPIVFQGQRSKVKVVALLRRKTL